VEPDNGGELVGGFPIGGLFDEELQSALFGFL